MLSSLQQYYLSRVSLDYSYSVSVIAKYSEPVFRKKNSGNLLKALAQLVDENQTLRGVFQKGANSQRWQFYTLLNKIKYGDVVERVDTPLEEFLQKVINADYHFDHESGKPLWKFIILDDNTACFCFSHALLDGISGKLLHKKFASIYKKTESSAKSNKSIDAVKVNNMYIFDKGESDYEDIIEAVSDKAINHKPSNIFMLKFIWKMFYNSWINTNFFKMGLDHSKPLESAGLLVNIDSIELDKILKACKKRDVRFSIWVMVAAQMALKELFDGKKIKTVTPINLRPYTNGKFDQDSLGLFPAAVEYELPVVDIHETSTKSFVEIAQECTDKLQESINSDHFEAIHNSGMLEVLPSIVQFVTDSKVIDRSTMIESSNVGLLKQSKNDLKIVDMIFTNSDAYTSPAFCCYTISTESGGANIFIVTNSQWAEYLKTLEQNFADCLCSIAK